MKILFALLLLIGSAQAQLLAVGAKTIAASGGTPTFVRGKVASGAASTNANTLTMASNFTAGHQVFVFGYACFNTSCGGTTGNINGVSIAIADTAGDTFTAASGAPIRSTTTNTTIFYAWLVSSAIGGNADITLTCSGGNAGLCSYVSIWTSEWTGVTAIDQFAASNHAGATSTTQATAAGTADPEAVVGAITTGTNPAITAVSPFTEISEDVQGVEHEYKIISTGNGNTQTCSWSWTGTSTSQTMCVTLK